MCMCFVSLSIVLKRRIDRIEHFFCKYLLCESHDKNKIFYETASKAALVVTAQT